MWCVVLFFLSFAVHAAEAPAGEIQMGGRMEFDSSPQPLLARFVESHTSLNEFERRDLQWWMEAVARVQGNVLELYEISPAPADAAQRRRDLVTQLSQEARHGHAFVQHLEQGYQVWTWEIRRRKIRYNLRKGLQKMAKKSPAAVHYRETVAKQKAQLAERAPAEVLRELLVREAPKARLKAFDGADRGTRRALAEAFHKASGRDGPLVVASGSDELPSKLEAEATLFVEDVDALDTRIQQGVLEAVQNGTVVYVGTEDIRTSKSSGKLRTDLYNRLSTELVDARRVHP